MVELLRGEPELLAMAHAIVATLRIDDSLALNHPGFCARLRQQRSRPRPD